MNENKNVIGNLTVNVNTKLTVDDDTFYTCLRLIAIHANQSGLKGLAMKFGAGADYTARLLVTDKDVDEVFHPIGN